MAADIILRLDNAEIDTLISVLEDRKETYENAMKVLNGEISNNYYGDNEPEGKLLMECNGIKQLERIHKKLSFILSSILSQV